MSTYVYPFWTPWGTLRPKDSSESMNIYSTVDTVEKIIYTFQHVQTFLTYECVEGLCDNDPIIYSCQLHLTV